MTDPYYGFGPRGSGGGTTGGSGIYRAPRPKFSEPVAAYNRGFGDGAYGGRGDTAQDKRPFQLVGKNKINLLDPGAPERQQEGLYEQAGIVPVTKHEGIGGGVLNYYDQGTPGGLLAGLAGVVGQGIGGIFGEEGAEQGSNIGAGIGKTFEIPFGAVGGIGLPSVFVPYIDQANAAIEPSTPYLLRDVVKVPKNLGDVAQSMLNSLGLLGRMVERTYAGFDERGGIPEDLAKRVDAGELTRDQALDEMAMTGRGFSDDPWHNMLISMLTDPLNLATLGVGTVGTAARGGVKLASQINRMGRALNAADHGADLGRLGDMVRGGQVVRPEDLTGMSRGALRKGKIVMGHMALDESKTNPLMKLAHLTRLHMVPSALEVLGPVPEVTSNLFFTAAQRVIRLTDPGTWMGGVLFGSGAVGRRTLEYLSTASTAGAFSAYDPRNISALADIADGVDGGGDLIMDTLGIHAANSLQEFALSEHVTDGLREGAVPVLSDINGVSLSATEATRSILRGGALDTNSGKHIELQIIRNMPNLYVRRAGEADEAATAARVLADSRMKLKSILGPTWDETRLTAGKMNERMASLIHAAYYYRRTADFHNEVAPVMVAAANAGTLPAGLPDGSRLTTVGDRTLTKGRVAAIRAALAAADVSAVRSEIGRYADFDWLNATKIDDREVIDIVTRWLDTNEGRLLEEVDFIDPATGVRYAGLPAELEDWLADADAGFGYRLAEAPPDNIPKPDLYGAVYRDDGTMVGMSPWLDFLANPAGALGGNWNAKRPGLAARYHQLAMGRVRQERIRWESQRRFITDMSKGSDSGGLDIAPELSRRLWQGIMSEAEHQRLQPRGLAPQDFSRVVRSVLKEVSSTQDRTLSEARGLTEHQVMNAFLRASKGDFFTVGATQYITGGVKAGGPGAGSNFWGQIAEKVYPLVRFTLNPIFQLQELLEPHILNVMRGVAVPLDRNSEKFKEGLATHNAIMQLVRTSFEPDGMMSESAEYLKLYAADILGVRQNLGATSRIGRFSDRFMNGIQERKAALSALEAKALFGDYFHRAMMENYGPVEGLARWREMEQATLSVDKGEVAMRWMATNMHLANQHGEQVTKVMDLLNDHTFGARLRVTHAMSPGAITFRELEGHIDGVRMHDEGYTGVLYKDRRNATGGVYGRGEALVEELRRLTEDDWMREAKALRGIVVSDEASRTIWRMANAISPDDFWRQYRDAYMQRIKDTSRVLTRKARDNELAFHRRFVTNVLAPSEGITEAEWIARHFQPNDAVIRVAPSSAVPAGALPDMRVDWPEHVLGDLHPSIPDGVQLDMEYQAGNGDWTNAEDYLYRSVNRSTLPSRTQGRATLEPHQIKNDWAEVDEIGWMSDHSSAWVRLPRDRYFRDADYDEYTESGKVLTNELQNVGDLEVFDGNEMRWRKLSDFEGMGPQVPPLPVAPTAATKLFANVGTETPPGLYLVDIDSMLTSLERAGRRIYKGEGYGEVNTYLRGVEWNGAISTVTDLDATIRDIDGAISRGALIEERRLWRGINLSRVDQEFGNSMTIDYENMVPGQVFSDPAYSSFTDAEPVATGFAYAGGHEYVHQAGEVHRSVVLEMDAPAGMNMAFMPGMEQEHLIAREQEFEVISRTVRKYNAIRGPNFPVEEHRIVVRPKGVGRQPGVNRVAVEELPGSQQAANRLSRDAVVRPEELNLSALERAADLGEEGLAEVTRQIEAAKLNRPALASTPEQSLLDDMDALTSDQINAAVDGFGDVRLRMQDIAGEDQMGMRLVHALARSVSLHGGMRLGWKELVRRIEDLWTRAPSDVTATAESIDRALLKGAKFPQRIEAPGVSTDDALDALLDNRSRRAVGRGEPQMPVLVDQFNMLDAGYAEDVVPNQYTHEYVVDFYNRKAAAANAQKWNGRADWSASEVALVSSRRYQQLTGKSGVAVDPREVDLLERTISPELMPAPGSAHEQLAPLIDIYQQKKNREKLEGLLDELGTTLGQQLRDQLGVPITRMDGAGVGMFDEGPQPILPVTFISSEGRADDLADVISYVTGQPNVWSYTRVAVDEVADLKPYIPRVAITVPSMGTSRWTQSYALALAKRMDDLPGAVATRKPNGNWELSFMDEGGAFRRLDDGSVDDEFVEEMIDNAIERTTLSTPEGFDPYDVTFDVEYGTVYKAGPTKLDDGSYDWNGHRAKTEAALQARDSRLATDQLDDLRSTYDWSLRAKLRSDAPKQYRRIEAGEPLVPGVLEDFRGGSVRGYTDIKADGRAVIAAVGNPDPLTGLHELMHVHVRGLDPSAKTRVIDAFNDWRTSARQDLDTRIAAADAKAAAAKSVTTAKRWQNEAIALRNELGGISNEVNWGPEHEEFLVRQFMDYIHSGRALNPEMANVMQHFRTWTGKLQNELRPRTGPQVPFSPSMENLFNDILRKPLRGQTHAFSVEHEIMRQTAKQTLRAAWDEAFGTHYYRKDRSWIERSANHPYIGVYPASYMWGKVLPEMFRFLTLRPFGYETPFLAWNVLREVSDTMRYQTETNSDLKEFLEGNERAFMLMNMLFPALPTEVPANVSLPVRRIAEQGLMNQMKFAKGINYGDERGQVHAVDYLSGLEDAVNYAIGPLGTMRQGGELVEMGFKAVTGGDEEEEAGEEFKPLMPLGINTP